MDALESYSREKMFLRPRMNKSKKNLSTTEPPSGGRKTIQEEVPKQEKGIKCVGNTEKRWQRRAKVVPSALGAEKTKRNWGGGP